MASLATPLAEVTLSLFGGTDTEISPPDLPEGLSPDNQDMIFLPGDTSSRPGLKKLFAAPLTIGGVSVLYEKSYVQPNQETLNLYLTSDGVIWVEDVDSTPGVTTQISTVPAGLYGQSVSAFGREYLAFSDLLHGVDIPRQFDGTNLDRVTQDGPGQAPIVTDDFTSYAIIGGGAQMAFAPYTVAAGPTGATQVGNIVTIITTAVDPPHPAIQPGDNVVIAGVAAGYNGTWPVIDTNAVGGFFSFTYASNVAGLAAGGGGTATFELALLTSAVNLPFVAGDQVIVAGVSLVGYNGTWVVSFKAAANQIIVRINTTGLGVGTGGFIQPFGQVSVGAHQCVYGFITRQGALTEPSPAFTWQAIGNRSAVVTNLALGPPNVVARYIAFTGAGGGNFFTIPAQITLPNPTGPATIIAATVVPDNTSTSFNIDFSDNALFGATPIDVIGNDLFDQIVLGPVLGFFAYADRLVAWGEPNKVNNFLNMGFDGGRLGALGATLPLGWDNFGSSGGAGNLVAATSAEYGFSYQMVSNNGAIDCLLQQSAYLDTFGDAILQPNTQYGVRFYARRSPHASPLTGSLNIELYSASVGSLAKFTLLTPGLSTNYGWISGPLVGLTPATIPSDAKLRIYQNTVIAGMSFTIDELELIFEERPFNETTARVSYVLNPEGFAQTTGNLGASDDDSPIRNFSLQRNVGELHTAQATHEFQDNNFEPGDGTNSWPVNSLTHSVGCLSLKGCDPGMFGTGDSSEDWDIIASHNGLYLHVGSDFYKVAQEMSRTIDTAPDAVTWDDINFGAEQTIWVKNDPNTRRAYVGVPVKGATAPNVVLVMDYRELDSATQIAGGLPLKIGMSAKMKSTDLTRKWTRWNVKASCGEILIRPGNAREFFFGGGSGQVPGAGGAFGNIYSLDPTLLTDDDYGAMAPYYTTYFFTDADTEQQLQIGSARHFYKHISGFVTGVGILRFTPFVNSLYNPYPQSSPRLLSQNTNISNTQPNDLEWATGIRGQRMALRIAVTPLPGTTDTQMKLQKFIIRTGPDPVAPFRGSQV